MTLGVIIHNIPILLALLGGWTMTILIAMRLRESTLMRPKTVRGLFVAVGFALTTMVVGMGVLQEQSNDNRRVTDANTQILEQQVYDRCINANAFRTNDRREKQQEIDDREERLDDLRADIEDPVVLEEFPGWFDLPEAVQVFFIGAVENSIEEDRAEIVRLEGEVADLTADLENSKVEFPIEDCGEDPSMVTSD